MPRGSCSMEKVILTPYSFSYYFQATTSQRTVQHKQRAGQRSDRTNLFQVCLHNLRAVVDGEHNISNTSISKGLNLVLDHGLVRKLDEGLRQGQGLGKL